VDDETRATLILERVQDDPKVQRVVADAHLYGELRSNPAWRRLYEETLAKRDRWMASIAKRFMGPQKSWPKPEEIAYNQGFYQGALWVLAHPEHAERNLERAAQAAWLISLEEEE